MTSPTTDPTEAPGRPRLSTGARLALLIIGSYALFGIGIFVAVKINDADVKAESKERAEAVEREAEERALADRRILVQRTVATCNERNHTKEVLRGTISAAIEGESTAPTDFTQVPGFDALDANTKTYLRNLSSATGGGSSSAERLRAYRDSLIDEDCVQLGEDLTEELESGVAAEIPAVPTTTTAG